MKRICFITQCSLPIPTTKGGAVETLVEYLLNENEKREEYEFTVVSIGDEKAEKIANQYKKTKFIYIDPAKKRVNAVLFQIYRVLKHLNIYIPFSCEFQKALKVLKDLHEQDYYIFEAGPTTQLPALGKIVPKDKFLVHIHWDGMGNKKKDDSFSYLIPVSDYIGRQWIEATHCNKKKVRPLYNCAKVERFTVKCSDTEKDQLRKDLSIPSENQVVIFIGRIVPEKGVKELLLAFEELASDKVTLMIIGSANFGAQTHTPYEREIERLIKSSKKSIVFTGFVHQTELYKYYSIADIAVMPSLFQDPAPLVCIETQATGTPLIATNVGGIPEYVGKDGALLVEKDELLVEHLTEKMELLLGDDDLRTKMSINEVKNALQYNTEEYFNNFCSLIREIDGEK